MEIVRKEYSYPSVTGEADIFARSWAPADGRIKAVVQGVHGMAEFGERYEEFATALCNAGFAFIMNDHIGHGKSVAPNGTKGYFGGEKNAFGKGFVDDSHQLTLIAKDEFKKPVIIFGHSMGSFVTRSYITKYADDIAAAVICGTSGKNPGAGAGILLASLISKVKGEKHPSKLIDKIAFGTYNKRTEGRTAFDWLSRNTENVDWYINNDDCGFLFTASGYKNMFELLDSVSTDGWYRKVPKDLSILLIAGEEDPVGAYSKGVNEVFEKLKATGHSNVQCKLYKDDRHEILNELDREHVFDDVIGFCDSVIK